MKLKLFFSTLLSLLFVSAQAQDRTTVSATSSEISDNLDLRAVASIFGDSKNLEDFENRLNDPNNQISNLDLNGDNQVDYLRVIESVEGRAHIIVIQSVLGRDMFQDVATLEVEKDSNNRVQVQVVGDVYMYGNNYIYEPVYVHTPVIYSHFWVSNYRPYYSSWYWGYYPSYYVAWHPFPIFRYRSHINIYINFNHHYNYVNYRRCQVAYTNYYGRRANAYERQYPTRSFASRNSGYTNRYELDKTRNIRSVGDSRNTTGTRATAKNEIGTRSNTSRNNQIATSRGTVSKDNKVTTSRGNSSGNNQTATSRGNSSRDNQVATSRGNTSRDNQIATSRGNSKRDNQIITSRSNSSRDNQIATSRGNTSRDNQIATPRGNGNSRSESRNFAQQREHSMPSARQASAPRNNPEPRGNPGGNRSRGEVQSSRSERR